MPEANLNRTVVDNDFRTTADADLGRPPKKPQVVVSARVGGPEPISMSGASADKRIVVDNDFRTTADADLGRPPKEPDKSDLRVEPRSLSQEKGPVAWVARKIQGALNGTPKPDEPTAIKLGEAAQTFIDTQEIGTTWVQDAGDDLSKLLKEMNSNTGKRPAGSRYVEGPSNGGSPDKRGIYFQDPTSKIKK